MPATGALERLRASNRRAVLNTLSTGAPLSRADLARATGLSRTTVSSLVADLVVAGTVVETADRGRPYKGGSGRPSVLLSLAAPAGVGAVDLGHRHVRVAVADARGRVLAERHAELDVDTRGVEVLGRAAAMLHEAATQAEVAPSALAAVGMCVPAPLDRGSSRVSTRILPGWRGLQPGDELAARVGVPVVVDNDANLGCLAELGHGAARGVADVIFVKVATGLGAGIALGGRMHRGATGIAGEIGHVQVGEDGAVCRCGNRGCLETLVSVPRLLALLRPAYDADLTVEGVLELERDGDAGVRRVLADAGHTIGRALADLSNSLNPELVIVGGSLGGSAALVDGIRGAIDRYAPPDTAAAVRVASSELGERAELIGALSLALARAAA